MIEPMVKIEIAGLLEELDRILDLLQRVGTVQIEELPTIESADKSEVHRIHLDKTKEHLLFDGETAAYHVAKDGVHRARLYELAKLTTNDLQGIINYVKCVS